MGLFNWLVGRDRSNLDVLPDRIWLTQAAKLDGIAKEVGQAFHLSIPPAAVILTSHFENNLTRLRAIAEESAGHPIEAVRADQSLDDATASFDESQTILLVADERHPLRSHDEEILEFARSLPCRSQVAFHLSLEDPLMRHFAGEWVQTVLKKLGMKEGEAIESEMVSRRIEAAQKEIMQKCVSDVASPSSLEWIRVNCPEMWREVK